MIYNPNMHLYGAEPHKIMIVDSCGDGSTSFSATYGGKTYYTTASFEVQDGDTVAFKLNAASANAGNSKVYRNMDAVQTGNGTYTVTVNGNLLVQFAQVSSRVDSTKPYEIYISDMPEDAKSIWLFNKRPNVSSMPITREEYDVFVDVCDIKLSNGGTEYNGFYKNYS